MFLHYSEVLLLSEIAPLWRAPCSGRLTERLMEELDRQLLHLVRVAQPEDFKGFLRLVQTLDLGVSEVIGEPPTHPFT